MIEITLLKDCEVAYIRRTGSYFGPQEHWGRLMNWAFTNGLFPPQQSFIGISLDNPDLVEPNQCRHDACVTIPEDFDKKGHQEVEFKKLDGGMYALHHFYDTPERLNSAYRYMFEQWLPASEYEADHARHTLEFNMNNPAEDSEGKCKVDIFVPITRKVIE